MPNIYFDGVDSKLVPICRMFGIICNENNINYLIKTDEIQLQEYQVKLRPKLVDLLKAAAMPDGIIVSYNNETLSIKPHRLSESRRSEYKINQLDPAGLERMQNWAIQYVGEKNRGPFSNIFNGMVLPVRIANVQSVWQSHLKDPRWDELGYEKSAYVDKPGDYPPIVVDTTKESQDYPAGRLVDGYKRLYAANHRKEQLIECIDMNDVITEANRHIAECDMNEYSKLAGDLMAHDQQTVIPKGSIIKVVDADEGLPDIEWEGKTINVDREALERVWKSMSFNEQIKKALELHDDSKPRIEAETEFENSLNEAFDGVSIVDPDVLFTLNQKLDSKITKETQDNKRE